MKRNDPLGKYLSTHVPTATGVRPDLRFAQHSQRPCSVAQ
jgi:hypothetical protein